MFQRNHSSPRPKKHKRPAWLGLPETVKRLKGLPNELSGKNGGPVRKAAFQATKVIEQEAERLSPKDTGRLERNIIVLRDRDPQKAEGSPTELYHVGVRGGGKYGARVRARERKRVYKAGGSIRQAQRAAFRRMRPRHSPGQTWKGWSSCIGTFFTC